MTNHASKVCIIYNESNIDDFTKYDPQKIYLIFSKLNENSFLFKIQHVSYMNILIINNFLDEKHPLEIRLIFPKDSKNGSFKITFNYWPYLAFRS